MDTYTAIRISIKITCDGRGMSRPEIDKLCRRLEKTAKGRSKTRKVSAVC